MNQVQKDLGNRLYDLCLRGRVPAPADIVFKEDVVKLKRCTFSTNRQTLPPICTHNVVDDGGDQVLQALRRCKLFNHREVARLDNLKRWTRDCGALTREG